MHPMQEKVENAHWWREHLRDRCRPRGRGGIRRQEIKISDVIRMTGEYYGFAHAELTAKCRETEVTNARQIAMFIARRLTKRSYPKIGSVFGGRHHTTVMHAVTIIGSRIVEDEEVREDVSKIASGLLYGW